MSVEAVALDDTHAEPVVGSSIIWHEKKQASKYTMTTFCGQSRFQSTRAWCALRQGIGDFSRQLDAGNAVLHVKQELTN